MTAKGGIKRQQILDAAEQILATQGSMTFSMRAVAERCELRLSNLQHYYPTLEYLLSALLETVLYKAEQKIQEAVSNGGDELESIILLTLAELHDQQNCQLIWEIWALAGRNKEAKQALKKFYANYIKHIQQIVIKKNSQLSHTQAQHKASMIVALLEGMSIIYAQEKAQQLTTEVYSVVSQTINHIIVSP